MVKCLNLYYCIIPVKKMICGNRLNCKCPCLCPFAFLVGVPEMVVVVVVPQKVLYISSKCIKVSRGQLFLHRHAEVPFFFSFI